MVGASRENVNRSLSQLVTLGALSMDGGLWDANIPSLLNQRLE
jgi:hypothetical protein